VDYRLLREKDGWRVYDVINRRCEPGRQLPHAVHKIIQTFSYDDLVKRMRAKDFSAPKGIEAAAAESRAIAHALRRSVVNLDSVN